MVIKLLHKPVQKKRRIVDDMSLNNLTDAATVNLDALLSELSKRVELRWAFNKIDAFRSNTDNAPRRLISCVSKLFQEICLLLNRLYIYAAFFGDLAHRYISNAVLFFKGGIKIAQNDFPNLFFVHHVIPKEAV